MARLLGPAPDPTERRFCSLEEIKRAMFPQMLVREIAARRRVEERREREFEEATDPAPTQPSGGK